MLQDMRSRQQDLSKASRNRVIEPRSSSSAEAPEDRPKPESRVPRPEPRFGRLIVIGALSLSAAACAGAAAQPSAPPPPQVTVAAAVSRELTEWDELTGRLEAVNTVDVRPRVSGYVSAVHFREGALVARGDLLFTIDPRPFQAEVDRLRAELERARAIVARADSELGRAERLTRENAISGEEHDRRKAFVLESRAQQTAIEAAVRAAELNLEFTRVTAPISGRIGRAIVTEGNLVSTGPGEATLLTTLVSLDPVYASFVADEQTFLRFGVSGAGRSARQAIPVRMAVGAERDFARQGRMHFLDNQVDASTGTIRARAIFANEDLSLTPGLFVRLRVPLTGSARGVLVQDKAVGTDLDKRFVLVVNEQQTVAYRPVSLGPMMDGLRVVRSGLEAGDLVLVNGTQHVRPGVKVRPTVVAMAQEAQR
jgi:multidrug efflux system membrane fusion protein